MEHIIARINELSRKNKAIGLTDEELAERAVLRKQYLDQFRKNFKDQLDSIEWTDDDNDTNKQ